MSPTASACAAFTAAACSLLPCSWTCGLRKRLPIWRPLAQFATAASASAVPQQQAVLAAAVEAGQGRYGSCGGGQCLWGGHEGERAAQVTAMAEAEEELGAGNATAGSFPVKL